MISTMAGRITTVLASVSILGACLPTTARVPVTGGPASGVGCAREYSPVIDLEGHHLAATLAEPSASAGVSVALAEHADFAAAVYALSGAVGMGGDPFEAFDLPGLHLLGAIYGPADITSGVAVLGPGTEEERPLHGFFAERVDGSEKILAFRGVSDPLETAANLRTPQARAPFAPAEQSFRVNRGLLRAYRALELVDLDGAIPLQDAFAEGRLGDGVITVIGHSLGGAMANLAAAEVVALEPDAAQRVVVTTFGAPRVGDAAFAEFVSSIAQNTRVCNLVDTVPTVPRSTGGVQYVHAGELRRYSSYDYGPFNNIIEDPRDQVACWHSVEAYRLMVEPASFSLSADGNACINP